MSSLPTNPNGTAGRQGALITLLGDEDETVHAAVRERVLALGPEALQWLGGHANNADPLVRRRVRSIMEELARRQADGDFLRMAITKGFDLDAEESALLLARTEYPSISLDGYRAMLDSFAAEAGEAVAATDQVEGKIAAINALLFEKLGFCGNEEDYYDPRNSYINQVIDRRTGNPIGICMIYLAIARRLRLPVAGIGMPGHFLCRYQSLNGEVFIDAFNRGKLLSKAECVKYLAHTTEGFREEFLTPVPARRMILRVCSNLHQIYSRRSDTSAMTRFQRYIVALARER